MNAKKGKLDFHSNNCIQQLSAAGDRKSRWWCEVVTGDDV